MRISMTRTWLRLLQVWVTSGGKHLYGKNPLRRGVLTPSLDIRNIGIGSRDRSSSTNGSDSPDSSPPGLPQLRTGSPPFGRLGGRRRPLSPLERISRLVPQDTLSQEVWELREGKQEELNESPGGTQQDQWDSDIPRGETSGGEGSGSVDMLRQGDQLSPSQEEERVSAGERMEISSCSHEGNPDPVAGDPSPAPPGERPLCFSEIALAEYRRKGRVDYRKMFTLQEAGKLISTWGMVPHDNIVGRPAGTIFLSSTGSPILVRRPSLEEYVLFMKRGPAIAYPKDASAMLLMMDVTEGDCVLESGSGSGAMSLFLSRAVGASGSVLSLEVREDHHKRAVLNYRRWRSAWSLRRGEEWPDNVRFHNGDIRTATHLLAGQGFHSVALDMLNPHLALPAVFPHLHTGAVCAVYLANITQVIDLLEGIRLSGLPLSCERVVEAQFKDWMLAPAMKKRDGKYVSRIAPLQGNQEEEEGRGGEPDEEHGESRTNERRPFGTLPYIARPHPEQGSHTAFLVKLRKLTRPL